MAKSQIKGYAELEANASPKKCNVAFISSMICITITISILIAMIATLVIGFAPSSCISHVNATIYTNATISLPKSESCNAYTGDTSKTFATLSGPGFTFTCFDTGFTKYVIGTITTTCIDFSADASVGKIAIDITTHTAKEKNKDIQIAGIVLASILGAIVVGYILLVIVWYVRIHISKANTINV